MRAGSFLALTAIVGLAGCMAPDGPNASAGVSANARPGTHAGPHADAGGTPPTTAASSPSPCLPEQTPGGCPGSATVPVQMPATGPHAATRHAPTSGISISGSARLGVRF